METKKLTELQKKLLRVEGQLDKCRTTTIQDGWQTSRHAKKSVKWDYYAQLKMKLIQQIEELTINNKIK